LIRPVAPRAAAQIREPGISGFSRVVQVKGKPFVVVPYTAEALAVGQ
jgi:hypothetical protein